MIFIPNFIKSDKVCWAIALNGGFMVMTEKISKSRFIIISIMPLIIVNAMASSVDILNLFLIVFQAPQNSYILNNGFETYVK